MQLQELEKNIPHDEKTYKDTLQSTQTQKGSRIWDIFAIYLPQMAFATYISQGDFGYEVFFNNLFIFK